MTKNELINLTLCVEVAQKNGHIPADAMVQIGVAYAQAKQAIEGMEEGDILIVFSPKKNELPGESEEPSQPNPESEQKPKKGK